MNIKYELHHLFLLALETLLLFLTTQCTRIEGLLEKETPRESYLNAIQRSPLSDTDIWQQWITIADSVITRHFPTEPAFQQKIIYL